MNTNDTLVLGGGQAGLALSQRLTKLGRDHLVLERGRIAERWHSERWNSLRLLTPNWMTRLPGWTYDGPDPDGFMTAPEVADFFTRYAASYDAPVREHTTIRRVAADGDRFVVETDDGAFRSHNVVIATGWCDRPATPAMAQQLSSHIHQLNANEYRSPADLPAGGVLVVGASATGVQLADELHRSGRHVTLAVGRHLRVPRRYRGMDIFWWLDLIGSFDKSVDDLGGLGDLIAARMEPSLQLVGRPDPTTLDLTTLQTEGVRLVGRLNALDGTRASLGTELSAVVAEADRRMFQVLERIDATIERVGLSAEVLDPEPIPVVADTTVPDSLDLAAAGINSVVLATGYRRPYDWLELPILDDHGEISQYRGVTSMPGAYVLGLRFQHFRNSNFIDGVGRDAQYVAQHITGAHGPLDRVAAARRCAQK